MFKTTVAIVATACAALSATSMTPASAATPWTAAWEMNEEAGAVVAVDSSGHGLHGRIGEDVRTGQRFGKRHGYRFPYISSSSPPNLQHIVEVPEQPALDPGTRDFTIKFGYRSTQSWGNLVQKGQSGMTGGFWKVESSKGVLLCLFRDQDGRTSTASSRTPLNDGEWHKILCTRTAESVTMVVDGQLRDTRNKPTGLIDNSAPLSIGGKRYCGGHVQCDYWFGDLNFIRISGG